ncbi:MAG: hypothetical protein NTZ16_15920, partial [Verrucomicrobia bacterium]|nr:hypothetical protein [Verrucomicrobiota bacterium]
MNPTRPQPSPNCAASKSERAIRSGLTGIGVWGALVGLTVLLTVLFSFLGNLTIAGISGLMLGSARKWRWSVIPVSAVFPAVILGLSHFCKIELPAGKVHVLALVCGAVFWGVYGVTFCLHLLEQKEGIPRATAQGRTGLPNGSSRTESDVARGFSSAELRGDWTCASAAPDGSPQHKTLRIEENNFVFTVTGPDGRQR